MPGALPRDLVRLNEFLATHRLIRIFVMISALLRVCRVRYSWKDTYQRQMAERAICLHYFDVPRISTVVLRANKITKCISSFAHYAQTCFCFSMASFLRYYRENKVFKLSNARFKKHCIYDLKMYNDTNTNIYVIQ